MKNVFIIDDDKFLLDMYALKFQESGYEVQVATNGSEALAKLNEGYRPNMVLLDIVMPGMDGLEFLKQAKEKKVLGSAIVVILSNLGQHEDIERGIEQGAKDYIVKASFTPREVVMKVSSILEKQI